MGEGMVLHTDKTRQDKTRQDKTRPDQTRPDKTRQDKTRQDKTLFYIDKGINVPVPPPPLVHCKDGGV